MKNNKVLIIIVVIVLNIAVGFTTAQVLMGKQSEYDVIVSKARAYAEQELYSKAIDSYTEAIALKDNAPLRIEMIDAYEKGLETGEFNKPYAVFSEVSAMVEAFRTDVSVYEAAVKLLLKYEKVFSN